MKRWQKLRKCLHPVHVNKASERKETHGPQKWLGKIKIAEAVCHSFVRSFVAFVCIFKEEKPILGSFFFCWGQIKEECGRVNERGMGHGKGIGAARTGYAVRRLLILQHAYRLLMLSNPKGDSYPRETWARSLKMTRIFHKAMQFRKSVVYWINKINSSESKVGFHRFHAHKQGS